MRVEHRVNRRAIDALRAEFARVGVQLDLEDRSVVDPVVIFHQMEPRNLGAAYQKYCGKTLYDAAHTSAADVRACHR